ncbi:MAG: Cna B-type domain-containing protein, partial [Erysipelotrichaceae bacterium]|nr:Cna B-type domain-containing protein [Erysipelotrichaceae bacterium]
EIKPDENGDWSCAWYALPKYENGKLITYKVTEDTVYEYSTEINNEYDVEHNQVNVTITNKYIKPSDDDTYITISGTKTWDDKDNQDGLRPASITVKLSATVDGKEIEILDKDKKAVETKVTVKADAKGNWSYSWKDLLKFKNGKEIKYSVTEEEVKYYTTTYDGYNIKNTHVPETVSVEGSKTWDDSNNSAGKRPTSITIRLLADGKEVKYTTVTEKSGWKWSFTGLPKYDNGKVITYTIKEDTVTGYTSTIKGYNVTNTYKPETVNISGQKVWNDSNDKDKIRPKSIEVYLLADGKVIQTITVTSTNSWKFTFSNLPKYSNGKAITYTIAEKPITGYTGVISGYTITNTHTPTTPNTPVTPPNTGDDSDVNGLMGILMTSLAGMVAVVLSRKKEETEA